ncbi:MAG: 16S rRNA (adenine(1518)-N(6)/adenine(1519)-N(6))-dimethyltransferase RsmA [Candidatus Altimarinota bacterium]
MLYNNSGELIDLLKKSGLYTEKRFGQNFLHNPGIITKILQAANLSETDRVVEIGPGLGILTLELAKNVQKVTTLELDQKLIPHLQGIFKDFPNIELINQDALKFIPPSQDYKLVANIPYYITSPIINHFLNPETSTSTRPSVMVLLVQLEVAQKIVAKPGDYGVLSLMTQAFGHAEIIAKVPPGNFLPAPKVDSAILKITSHPQPLIKNFPLFEKLIKKAFSQRRKTLSNTLIKGSFLPAEQMLKAFEKSGISLQERPQNLTLSDWNNLIEAIE